ncbi:baseplate J/gp47 family protein [Variovorax sp. PAMC26660]|uniref:baseplate J/gp47 family protein n=1 Tax=Variovorax sp. PAMC26660 TaxID=2762322 RepID=UPI00164E4F03|nr:baseplate J/gp47 family protein [Variovorax sp. PAMC26660]QNK65768.1 baseplate J/gp47 family protein [Variovorax sp. PAMC26660]
MPYSRPKLSELKNLVARDIESSLPGADALLRFSNIGATGNAQANLSHLHYGYLDWIAQQAVPWTATGEFLEAWAGLKGVIRKATAQASGSASFPGVIGTVLPAGTSIVRGDGLTYTSNADATVDGTGFVTVVATAVSDPAGLVGANGNAAVGVVLTLGASIPGIQSGGVAATAFTGGADVEQDDSLRTRMLAAYQKPPQGGSADDYVKWATAVPGVTRAWCKPRGFGDGTVVVYTMFDQAEAAFGGFPQGTNGTATGEDRAAHATGDQLAVANAIFPLQPVTALVYSCAATAFPVNFTITGLTSASLVTRALIAAAIDGVFYLEGTPTGGTVALSLIESAIAAISGTKGFVITVPSGNIATALGFLPVRGTVTYP